MPSKNKKKILIVEDEAPLSNALKLKFEDDGYSVAVSNDGEEGLKLLHSNKFDAIILDLMLPKVDGFSVLKEISKTNPEIPVFVSTNLGHNEDEKKIYLYPQVKHYFIKSSVSLNDIIKTVDSYLNKK